MPKKIYEKLANAIINEVNRIVGPVAIMQANTVNGLKATTKGVKIERNPVKTISDLINAYKTIMGDVAITLVKKGAAPVLEKNPKLKVPAKLKGKL